MLIDAGIDLGLDTDAKVIKSVLMNSADKLANWSHSPTTPLDLNQGAGQMNLESAYLQYTAGEQESGTVTGLGWDHGMLTGSTANTYQIGGVVDVGSMIVATLTWNRDVTTDTEDIESAIYTADPLENLELFLYDANDLLSPVASSISSLDNVEHLFLSAPTSGNYVFEVRAAGGSVMNPTSYSLAWDVEVVAGIPGDFNGDGFVDSFDFLEWQRDPSIGDIAEWEANYGLPTIANTTAVPEPCALALAFIAFAFTSSGRRR